MVMEETAPGSDVICSLQWGLEEGSYTASGCLWFDSALEGSSMI